MCAYALARVCKFQQKHTLHRAHTHTHTHTHTHRRTDHTSAHTTAATVRPIYKTTVRHTHTHTTRTSSSESSSSSSSGSIMSAHGASLNIPAAPALELLSSVDLESVCVWVWYACVRVLCGGYGSGRCVCVCVWEWCERMGGWCTSARACRSVSVCKTKDSKQQTYHPSPPL